MWSYGQVQGTSICWNPALKPVAPKVVTQAEIARAAIDLLGRSDSDAKDDEVTMQRWLSEGVGGVTLFVFDNFETVYSPADVFRWMDTYIRPPNKVLVTTRVRDFVGDYPIEVGGMNDVEAERLLKEHGARLGISHLLTTGYLRDVIAEAEGHPYVMKVLLGEVAKEGRAVNPARIIGSAGELLTALFERTFSVLAPAAQRVFLLLSSWRVFVPEIAVEAVALRPGNERFDVRGALADLRRYSLIEHVKSDSEDEEDFVGVPLAAAIFGRRKMETSPYRLDIQQDRKLLMEFGPGRRGDVRGGIMARVDRLIREIARRALAGNDSIESMLPVLEYIAGRVPRVYLRLAELVREGGLPESLDRANGYLGLYLERAVPEEKAEIWTRRAEIYRGKGDAAQELHALAEVALCTGRVEEMGRMANWINNKLLQLGDRKAEILGSFGLRETLRNVAERMHARLQGMSATDCSRLAWLMLNLGNAEQARDVAKLGLEKNPKNEYCEKLVERLGA
ncbi:MAG: hypothetical protein F4Y86_08710 [Gammaproteobacteria bacterium]|nr:hypothetical protein [Gammaproteobacteria bacterium]